MTLAAGERLGQNRRYSGIVPECFDGRYSAAEEPRVCRQMAFRSVYLGSGKLAPGTLFFHKTKSLHFIPCVEKGVPRLVFIDMIDIRMVTQASFHLRVI